MSLRDAILNFPKQFSYKPVIENADRLVKKDRFLVCGMGGSHLAADFISAYLPQVPLTTHRDYGLPATDDATLRESLIVASSYSGSTEETLDVYDTARAKGLACAAIAVGGALIERAKADGTPYIQLPHTGIQPRSALGFSVMAHFALFGLAREQAEAKNLASTLDPKTSDAAGKKLAEQLTGRIPIIYASQHNWPIAWNWKIKLNENTKIPAFFNVVPELNHHEMNGFDVTASTRALSESFTFLFLRDEHDHPRVQQRFAVLEKLYADRGFAVIDLPIGGRTTFERFFSSLILADWTTYHLGTAYGVETEQVPMVEEFKKLITA